MTTRLSVAGGTPMWRRGLQALLEEAVFEVVMLDSLADWRPGLGGSAAVVHGGPDVGESIGQFGAEHPHIPIVVVEDDLTVASFSEWLRAGATCVLGAGDQPDDVISVIQEALAGRCSAPAHILEAMARKVPDEMDLSAWLNDEEASWLREMSGGLTVSELAADRGYSERAMFRMLRALYARLGVRNRTEALLWAERHGVLSPVSGL